MARTGRRPGRNETRERILEAARRCFGESGLEHATMRMVAAEAGVDPALIHHYFHTKQQLFVLAMELPFEASDLLPGLLDGPRDELGLRLARLVMSLWEAPRWRPVLEGTLRATIGDQTAATTIRDLIVARVLGPLLEVLDVPDPDLRATLIGSQVVGMAVIRYVLRVEPLASYDPEALAVVLAPTFQRYLVAPLGT